eukprot:m.54433 g.54433  ORF g.54433 m.54433 type:complete len:63 (-) comp21912_c0_seq2:60-248(-)
MAIVAMNQSNTDSTIREVAPLLAEILEKGGQQAPNVVLQVRQASTKAELVEFMANLTLTTGK